ncbi:hypothetical protein GCM10009779_33660 [Polymorphospora rubra]|uniref:Uncharacterized protein n=1 Tax=Polymorphospora rubra TaxID=338584 RepID=A0A810MQ43_9ACTN|nr:hypothetical protein Prubr_00330 [Polymorphospora rubra]
MGWRWFRGRRKTSAGSGTGAHCATGTAKVRTEPVVTSPPAPAPTVEAMIALVNQVCANFARAEVARATAEHSTSRAEYDNSIARAGEWDALVNEQWRALAKALRVGLPKGAQVERFQPVRPLPNGHVELHLHDPSARRLVVLLTGEQALAVGAHLTATGAIVLDRIGQLNSGLPHVKAAPPFAPNGTVRQPATPPDAAGPPADRP